MIERGEEVVILSGPEYVRVQGFFVEEKDGYIIFAYEPLQPGRHRGEAHHVISKRRVLKKCAA
jgi:hypothetical protein